MSDIAVIGAGSYGSCLAMLFGRAGHRVSLWCRNPETAEAMQRTRATESYLPGHTLPETVTVTSELEHAVRGKQFVVGVTPSLIRIRPTAPPPPPAASAVAVELPPAVGASAAAPPLPPACDGVPAAAPPSARVARR